MQSLIKEALEKQTDPALYIEKLAKEGNVYIVAQDGTGDFLTIQEGVDAVNSGDTLIICPGVYEENVEIMAKTVNLLGVDRDSCILQYVQLIMAKYPLQLRQVRSAILQLKDTRTQIRECFYL